MARTRADKTHHRYTATQFVVMTVVVMLVAYAVTAQFAAFTGSIATLRDGYVPYLIVGALCWICTLVAATGVYMALATKRLRFWPTLCVQTASCFANKLIPAGTGALAVGTRYLMSRGLNAVAAASIALLNNLIGFVGSMLLLLMAAAASEDAWPKVTAPCAAVRWVAVAVVVVLCVVAAYAWKCRHRGIVRRTWARISVVVRSYGRHPWRLVLALAASMAVTIGYAACMWMVALAFNVHISIFGLLAVLTISVALGSATPTPGGLGGAEAGLVAALITLNVPAHQALVVALAYRLITYWLPMAPGFACLRIAQKQHLI